MVIIRVAPILGWEARPATTLFYWVTCVLCSRPLALLCSLLVPSGPYFGWLPHIHKPRGRLLHYGPLNMYGQLWPPSFFLVMSRISWWLIFRHPTVNRKLLMKWTLFHETRRDYDVPQFLDVNLLITITCLYNVCNCTDVWTSDILNVHVFYWCIFWLLGVF